MQAVVTFFFPPLTSGENEWGNQVCQVISTITPEILAELWELGDFGETQVLETGQIDFFFSFFKQKEKKNLTSFPLHNPPSHSHYESDVTGVPSADCSSTLETM